MAKNYSDIPKSTRLLQVYRIMEQLGRATPEDVLVQVCSKLALDTSDKNLRRNIYRDLKSLAESGELWYESYAPDGRKLSPDEEENVQNFRVEYVVPGRSSPVIGEGLLNSFGACIVPPSSRKIDIRCKTISGIKPSDSEIYFVFEFDGLVDIAITIPKDSLPVKVLLARTPADPKDLPDAQLIENQFGLRTIQLFLPDSSISRCKGAFDSGHAMFEFRPSEEVILTNLGATTGIFSSTLNSEDTKKALQATSTDITMDRSDSVLRNRHSWSIIVKTQALTDNCLIKLGDFRFSLITNASK